jgi:hypothetical protein
MQHESAQKAVIHRPAGDRLSVVASVVLARRTLLVVKLGASKSRHLSAVALLVLARWTLLVSEGASKSRPRADNWKRTDTSYKNLPWLGVLAVVPSWPVGNRGNKFDYDSNAASTRSTG